MNRLNPFKYMQHFDAYTYNLIKRKEKKKAKMFSLNF